MCEHVSVTLGRHTEQPQGNPKGNTPMNTLLNIAGTIASVIAMTLLWDISSGRWDERVAEIKAHKVHAIEFVVSP